jgi:DivIVA domain-containing protein
MDDERIVISSSAAISPEAVAGKGFTTVLRGYQPAEVRQFLKRVADEVAAAQEREGELRRALHDAQNRAAHPELDEAALTSSLGEHAGRLIASAREMAASITAEAERTAAATLRDAEYRIARIRQEADTLMARRVDEADGVSASLRQSAEADARAVRDQAQAEAEAAIQAARSHGKEMVAEARAVRERMLGDLARRRRVAEVQLEQLRVARERLVQAYDVVRHTLEEVTAELASAEPEARLAAEAVGRRMSDADAHPPLRMAESQLRVASAAGVGPPPPPPPPPSSASSFPPGSPLRRSDPLHRITELPSRPAASAFGSEPLPPTHSPSSFQPSQPAPPTVSAPAAPVPSERPPVPPAWIERAGGSGGAQRSSPSPLPPPVGPVLVPAAGIGGGATPPEPVFDPADPGTWAGAGFGKPREERGAARPPFDPGDPPAAGSGPSEGPSSSPGGAAREVSSEPSATPAPTGEAAPPADPTVTGNPSLADPDPGPASGPTASARGGAESSGGAPAGSPPPPPVYGGGNRPASTAPEVPAAPTRPPLRPQAVADSVPYRSRTLPPSPLAAGGPGHPSRPLPGGSDAPGPGGPSRPPGAAGSGAAGGTRTGSSRTALDLRPTPPDLPREVPAARPDQPPELATSEQPVVRTPGEGPVDELFARLRHQAEAEPPAAAATASPTPPAPSVEVVEEAALAQRDQQLDPIEADLTRTLKRILQDEQNGVLERLREGGRAGASSVMSAIDEQATSFTAAAAPALAAAYRAGGGDTDDTAGFALGGKLATDLAAPLRERLERVVATAGDDMEELAEAVRAAYRHTKLQEIEQLVRHHTAAAHALGAYAATAAGTLLQWVVDDEGPCPDCHDNTLAGPTAKGEAYPTGQDHPPAHRGCRCLLVPVAT